MKSKKTKVFTTEDGRRASFDFWQFSYYVGLAKNHYIPQNPKKKPTLEAVFRQLAVHLGGNCEEVYLESYVQKIKQWYYEKNGPSELDDIYKMAECLECERKDQFLKYEKQEEKEMIPTTNTVQNSNMIMMPSVEMLTTSTFRAMKKMRVQEEAYHLHSMFIDLIAAYNKADMDTWLGNEPLSVEWKAAAKQYPDRMPVERAVQKASCYLPSEIQNSLFAFLEDMFGPAPSEWYEINSISKEATTPFECIEHGDFIDNKLRRFSTYLKEHDIDESSLDVGNRESWMYSFLSDEAGDWYYELDRIFEDYIAD